MNKDYIKSLIDKYFEGETTLVEERVLKEYFKQSEIDETLGDYRAQFNFLAKESTEETEEEAVLFEGIENQKVRQMTPLTSWALRVAAGLLLVAIGYGAGQWSGQSTVSPNEMSQLKNDVEEMKKMLMLASMQQASASERIKVVNLSTQLDEANQEIIAALLSTLNFDSNVNVRMAACEALYQWKAEAVVRRGLTQSLRNQADPRIQIAIIDMLVAMKEKGAVQEMQILVQQKGVMDIVKTKAQNGIARLL